jgi:hypothetical protein
MNEFQRGNGEINVAEHDTFDGMKNEEVRMKNEKRWL